VADLFAQLGIDWRLLLAQGVNFFVLLAVLTAFVYRPLLKLLDERRRRIEFGLRGAEEAEHKLAEIEATRTKRLADADQKAALLIGSAEEEAIARGRELVSLAKIKAEAALAEAAKVAEHRSAEELERVRNSAGDLIREAIAKAVEVAPDAIDARLVARATSALRPENL
jgi:F-type H+-transporting ATPase subunit b